MSGIAALFHRDGAPADARAVTRALAAIAYRGPDASGVWAGGNVGLGHVLLRTVPEDAHAAQPISDRGGAVQLVFDGRLDNRRELTPLLDSLRAEGEVPDSLFVLHAYRQWGEECFARLLGDFALVIWDSRHRRLLCARDALSIRPLFYYLDERRFVCASEPVALFASGAVPCAPNEGAIGEYLCAAVVRSREETLYCGVRRLPGGDALAVTASAVRRFTFWNPAGAAPIRYRRDEDYAEHLRALLDDAVEARMRAVGPVGVQLSGGLDSSIICGIAAALARTGRVSGAPRAYSVVYPGRACDESEHIAAAVRHTGVHSTLVPENDSPRNRLAIEQDIRRHQDFPEYPNQMTRPLLARARRDGVRVTLKGYGGDEWFMGSPGHYADLLSRGRLIALWRQARDDARTAAYTLPRRPVLTFGVWGLLASRWRQRASRDVRRLIGREHPRWIGHAFARRIQLNERLRWEEPGPRFPSYAQTLIHSEATGGTALHALESFTRSAAIDGIEERHPLTDRRVVEFALHVPERQRWRAREGRFVLRNAARDVLPDALRARRDKADFSHVLVRELEACGGEQCFANMTIAGRGWVEPSELRRLYREMLVYYRADDPAYERYTWPLWMCFAVELWFTTMFASGPGRPAEGARAVQIA